MSELTINPDVAELVTGPETFDIDAWLTDAKLPEESASVYKRPDVIAELTDLKRRIKDARTEEADATFERTASEVLPSQELEAEYESLLNVFGDSQLTVYVRALTKDEMSALRETHEGKIARGELTEVTSNATFGYDLLSEAIVSVKPAGGKRVDVKWTPKQVKAMEQRIGAVQMPAILEARQRAQNAMPTVDADFLHKSSGTEADED